MWSRVAELRIREAIKEGVFDDLPNRGRPLDLDEYFAQPEDVRLAYSILKSANCVPEEVLLLKDLARLDAERRAAIDPGEQARLVAAVEQTRLKLTLLLEQRRTRAADSTGG